MSECLMSMGGGLVAMEQLSHSGQLCGVLKSLGIVPNCPIDLGPFQDKIDKKIMCEVFRCCQDPKRNPRADGAKFSSCVDDVFNSVDQFFGRKSRYKSEVSYKKDGAPWMYGNSTTPRHPTGAFPRYPSGSRRPDVVAVKNPSLPPIASNIQNIYEFKFTNAAGVKDTWGNRQFDAYKELNNQKDPVEISEDTCNEDDPDGKKSTVLATASATQLAKDNAAAMAVNQTTAAAAAALPAGRAATAASWLGRSFGEALAAFGRMLRPIAP
jgi:hypothetical protein